MTTTTSAQNTDRVDTLIAAASKPVSPARRESLIAAAELGADDATLALLIRATRLARTYSIVLPAGRYAGLSRSRGWCRQGTGERAAWGTKDPKGWRVGVGAWTVYSSDGFRREERTAWSVRHVTVGSATWTIAD